VQANFDGGEISSDAGAILLRQADKIINLTDRIAATAFDPRNQKKINHTILAMLHQRVYGLALGYEDLNDHDTLRNDTAIQATITDIASFPFTCSAVNICWLDI